MPVTTICIAAPPIAWPCYLGIDTPTREELCINRDGSSAAVQRFLGVGDLRYLSEAGLKRAVGGEAFCFGCMNGDYPL